MNSVPGSHDEARPSVPDVGHVPMIDDPGLTARTILDFIDQVSAHV